MPTGWRPDNVNIKFPLDYIENPKDQIKYKTKKSKKGVLRTSEKH